MTTLATVLTGPQTVNTTATAPSMGTMNSYNAASGALSPTLPALSGLNVGAYAVVEKYQLDGTYNAVTFTASGSDMFDDGTTSAALYIPGDKFTLQVVSLAGTKFWKRQVGASYPKLAGLATAASQFSLTNSTTATTVITNTLPAGLLNAGSTFRIQLNGTIASAATSGTLTFTPNIQGTALAQTAVMASTTSANAASPFTLQYLITVRTTGSSGTAIATPYGIINLATTGVVYLTSTSASTTTINTTAAASSNAISVQATWATASASNVLLVQTATIERVI